ncbi:MAG TPA: HlyC/CorC family transporter [Bacteroidetes bacterium]|nr:HlyC/CorC family transporter [Bacteroidota bacterium]
MVSETILIVSLILLNGFFVAAEFAIIKARLPQLQEEQGIAARIAVRIIEKQKEYLTAIQLGITISSLGLGWASERVMAGGLEKLLASFDLTLAENALHVIAYIIAFAFIVVLHFVFGELIPQGLAVRHPINTTLGIAWPLRFIYFFLRPFVWLLGGIADFFLRVFGINSNEEEGVHSEEELKMIIAESAEGGAIEASERELIQNVFDFDDRFVWQILQPRAQIAAIEINTPLNDAIQFSLDEGYSRFPVYEESIDNILGFIHAKDLLKLSRENNSNKKIENILRPVQYVSSNKKVMHLLRQFQKEHEHLAIVVNEFGGTVGLITLEDIIEELVGEIQDEYDTETPIVEKKGDHIFKIQAQNPIDDINEYLPFPFSEGEEYHTLSGLILKISEDIPAEGDKLRVDGYEVEIVKMFQASPEVVRAVYLPEKKENNMEKEG